MSKIRLQKILSSCGIASRRKAEDLIKDGRVTVNDRIVCTLPVIVDPKKDTIYVDGRHLSLEKKRYFIFYKPQGVMSTVSDTRGRPKVSDFFTSFRERLYPVGRLDYNSEGLLLVTNDGDWANEIAHPSRGVHKVYRVNVKGEPSREKLLKLTRGIRLSDGKVKAEKINILKINRGNAWVDVELIEGKKHVIRRMFLAIGYPVLRLIRIRVGPFTLGQLKKGEYREIKNPSIIYKK